jgi:hypothetical protein
MRKLFARNDVGALDHTLGVRELETSIRLWCRRIIALDGNTVWADYAAK